MKPFVIEFVRYEHGSAGPGLKGIELPYGRAAFVGRHPEADLHILDGTVGKPHAMLTAMPHELRVLVVDFGCSSGTWVSGECKPLQYLKLNQEFRIAKDFWFRVSQNELVRPAQFVEE